MTASWFERLVFALLSLVGLSACDNTVAPSDSLEVAAKGLYSATLSRDGEYALIGSIYHGGSLWRISTKERLFNWNHSDTEASALIAVAMASNPSFSLTAEPHKMVLWDTTSGNYHRFWTAPAEILDVALSKNGKTALLGLDDSSAVLFDIQRGGILQRLEHQNRVRSVAMSDDGSTALTGSEDYHARLWDVKTGKVRVKIKHQDDVQLVDLSADGTLALSVSKYDRALLWETETGAIRGQLAINSQGLKMGVRYTASAFNHDTSLLLTGRTDQLIELWDMQNLEKIQTWKLPKRHRWKPTGAAALAVGFTKDPNIFLAVASNGFVHQLPLSNPAQQAEAGLPSRDAEQQ